MQPSLSGTPLSGQFRKFPPRSFDVKNNLCSVSSTRPNRSLRKCKDNSSVSTDTIFFFLACCNFVNWRCNYQKKIYNKFSSPLGIVLRIFEYKQDQPFQRGKKR